MQEPDSCSCPPAGDKKVYAVRVLYRGFKNRGYPDFERCIHFSSCKELVTKVDAGECKMGSKSHIAIIKWTNHPYGLHSINIAYLFALNEIPKPRK